MTLPAPPTYVVPATGVPILRIANLGPEEALRRRLARRLQLRRRWRGVARAIGPLLALHRRAVERAYAPGGAGYNEAAASLANAASAEAAPAAAPTNSRKRKA